MNKKKFLNITIDSISEEKLLETLQSDVLFTKWQKIMQIKKMEKK